MVENPSLWLLPICVVDSAATVVKGQGDVCLNKQELSEPDKATSWLKPEPRQDVTTAILCPNNGGGH